MSNPRTDLRHIIDITHHLLDTWTKFAETYDALGQTDSDRLGVHGGDICDPVYAGAIANEKWTETTSEISEALGILRRVEQRVAGTTTQHPETARTFDAAKRAARCADPVCEELDVKHGYCDRHWQIHRLTCRSCSAGASATA